jgi:hypothetical protein
MERPYGCDVCEKRKVCSKCKEMCEILEHIDFLFTEEVVVEDDVEVIVKCRHFILDASIFEEKEKKNKKKKKGEEEDD